MELKDVTRKGNYGVVIRIQIVDQNRIPRDISTYPTRQIRFKKPDGTIVQKTAILTTTGLDGNMEYVVEVGFLDQSGFWEHDAYIQGPGFGGYSSETATFEVRD